MDDTAVVDAAAVAVVVIITNFLNKARRADEPLCPQHQGSAVPRY